MIKTGENDQKRLPANVTGSGVARSKRWLVAYVRMRHEKKTSERLTQMGIENFLPVQEEIHQWSDRRKRVERVLMPMMIFVHVDLHQQKEVLTLSSVSRYMVLRGESTPAVVPDVQMERFKFMLDYSDETIQFCTEPLRPGQQVCVIKGPMSGLQGELAELDGKTKVFVRIHMLGCACVSIPAGCVEPLPTEKTIQ